MKAVLWTGYGSPDVLQNGDIEKPTPKPDELLIKVHATTAFMGDCELRSLQFSWLLSLPIRIYVGFLKPSRIKVLGQEYAGEVVEVGSKVSKYKVGDRVLGSAGFRMGAYAEYICVPETQKEMGGPIAHLPQGISYEEAAPLNIGGSEALHFMRVGNVKAGDKILINGGGGSIGSYAIQLAKHYGAEVTAVDRTEKLEMMRELGAMHVIDYTKEDFTQSGQQYDVILDVVGKASYSGCMRSLKKNGRYMVGNPQSSHRFNKRFRSRGQNQKVILETAQPNQPDLNTLTQLMAEGHIKSVIDKPFTLSQMADAHRYVESGMKKGNVVVSLP